jgi:Na+/alanine symporter
MLGNSAALYYNTFFCVSLAYSINNTLRKPFLDNLKMHLICLLATVTAILIILFTQNSGAPLSGICIYRVANQSSLGVFFVHLLLLLVCLYSMRKFRAKIPKNSYFEKRSHFRYYNTYLTFFVLCEAANTLLYLIGNISCQASSNDIGDLLENLYVAANVIAILQGLGIALLRLSHPKFVKKVKGREEGAEMV